MTDRIGRVSASSQGSTPHRRRALIILTAVALGSIAGPAQAFWSASRTFPMAAASGAPPGLIQSVCPDSSSGLFALWVEYPAYPAPPVLRVQHFDRVGRATWPSPGVVAGLDPVPVARAVPDGSGGCFVAWAGWVDPWNHTSPSCCRVQHLSASGASLWSAEGIALSSASVSARSEGILADGAGGVFVSWGQQSLPGFDNPRVHVQRVDASGTPLWAAGGVDLGPSYGLFDYPPVAPLLDDGEGGVLVGNAGFNGLTRLDAGGSVLWSSRFLTSVYSSQEGVRLEPDGTGGALASWRSDHRDAQRVALDGSTPWGNAGVRLPWQPNGWPGFVQSDGAGGMRVIYPDTIALAMHAQHYGADGALDSDQPSIDLGFVVYTSGLQTAGLADGSAWLGFPYDVCFHRMLLTRVRWEGTQAELRWSQSVIELPSNCRVGLDSWDLVALRDGSLVAAISTNDGAGPAYAGIPFLCRVDPDGHLGTTEPVILSARDVPGDDGGFVRLRWRPSDLVMDSTVTGLTYEILRAPSSTGPWSLVNGPFDGEAAGDSADVATFADSTASCDCRTWFTVRALASGGIVRDSPPEAAASQADGLAGVGDHARHALQLGPLSPSPMVDRAELCFTLPRSGTASLTLFDAGGRRLRSIARGDFPAGEHRLAFRALDASGRHLRPGVYFVRLETRGGVRDLRVVVRR